METITLQAAQEFLNKFNVQKVVSIISRYKNVGINDSYLQRVYAKALLADSPEPLNALDRAERFVDVMSTASEAFIEYLETPTESAAKAFSNELSDYITKFSTAMYKCEDYKTPFNA